MTEPFKSLIEATRGVTVIDLTSVTSGDSNNHNKFAASPAIVQLIGSQLMEGQDIVSARCGPFSDVARGITAPVGRIFIARPDASCAGAPTR